MNRTGIDHCLVGVSGGFEYSTVIVILKYVTS